MPREKDTYLNRDGLEYYHRKIKQEFATKDEVAAKQDQLTSQNAGEGIAITTDQSGKVIISNTNVSAEWGNIQGDITDQTDLINYIEQHGGAIDTIEVNGVPQIITDGVVDITVPTATSQLTNDSDYVSDVHYVHTDNNFTNNLKTKLEGIQEGAEVNVQANWNESDSSSDAYILNKPTIPVSTSDLINDGDGTNPFVTTSYYQAGNGIQINQGVISLKSLILDCGTSTTVI